MPEPAPLINEEADRRLGRIILRHGLAVFALLLVAPFVMAPLNMPSSRFFPDRRFWDTVSVMVILAPFFWGINKLFAERLRLGRELSAQGRWREAIAALDPFAGPTQRFLDTTGEAHFLLAQAYERAGQRQKAAQTRAFLVRHRHFSPPSAPPIAPPTRPVPAKKKRRRRF